MKISPNTKFFNGLSLRIILLFGMALGYSLLMDYLQLKEMLDTACEIYTVDDCWGHTIYGNSYPIGFYHTHWSSNHYLYFFMNLGLMLVQFFRIIDYIDKYFKK